MSRIRKEGNIDIEFFRFHTRWIETGILTPTLNSSHHKDESGRFLSSREIVLTLDGELYQLILIKYGCGLGEVVSPQYFDSISNYRYLRVNVYALFDDLFAELIEGTDWTEEFILQLTGLYERTLKHQEENVRRTESGLNRIKTIAMRHHLITSGKS